jgi:hypothetical protein
MIVRLLPTQIGRFWDLVKPGVIEVGGRIAPGDWNLANNALQLCMSGLMQAWLCSEENEEKEFKGVVLTSITNEYVSNIRALTLWLLFFYKAPSQELIRELRAAIIKYAKVNNCPTVQLQQIHDMSDTIVDKWWEGKWTKRSIYTLHY